MRDLFKKVMTGSMVAGAALLVAACGGGEDATANNTAVNITDDSLMGNDTGILDATNGSETNLGAGADVAAAGTGTDLNVTVNTTDATENTTAATGNTPGR